MFVCWIGWIAPLNTAFVRSTTGVKLGVFIFIIVINTRCPRSWSRRRTRIISNPPLLWCFGCHMWIDFVLEGTCGQTLVNTIPFIPFIKTHFRDIDGLRGTQTPHWISACSTLTDVETQHNPLSLEGKKLEAKPSVSSLRLLHIVTCWFLQTSWL